MNHTGDTERFPIVSPPRSSRFSPPRTTAAPVSVPYPPFPVPRPRRRTLRRAIVGLALLMFLAPPLLGASLVVAVYRQARTDQTRPVDAIVVLGTAQFNGRPGPVLRARLDRALAVYEAGYAPVVVVTGGKRQGDAFTEAEASRDYLIERGVPPAAILMENEGRDSWQSMRAVARIAADRDLARVLLVSDGFHLFRLKKMAHDLGLTAYATAAEDSPIRSGGPAEFSYAVREAAGVLVYLWQTR